MSRKIEMTGKRFGRLVVLREAGRDNDRNVLWKCLCDCGNIKVVSGRHLRTDNTKSCGCLHIELLTQSNTTHGMTGTPEYIIWAGMIKRCTNKNSEAYRYYGGRGIKVCDRWLSFENFYKDMGDRPEGLSIDRKDNDKGYYLENCRWATPVEQASNRRMQSNNKTGISGVYWNKSAGKYQAEIQVNHKRIYLGTFTNLQDAAKSKLLHTKII